MIQNLRMKERFMCKKTELCMSMVRALIYSWMKDIKLSKN